MFAFFTTEKKCDLNKPCGVLDPERKELSSQELICTVNARCLLKAFCLILFPVSLLVFITNKDTSILS